MEQYFGTDAGSDRRAYSDGYSFRNAHFVRNGDAYLDCYTDGNRHRHANCDNNSVRYTYCDGDRNANRYANRDRYAYPVM